MPSSDQQELLRSLKQAVRSVQQVALDNEGAVKDCEQVETLIKRLEDALLDRAHSSVEVWDMIGGPICENEEFAWVRNNVNMLKSKSAGADRKVLGRRWLRDSLNTATLSAFLALIAELPDTVLAAYYKKDALLADMDTSSLLLNIIIPIGGADIDARRGVDGASLIHQAAFIRFSLQIICSNDDDIERKRSESLLVEGIIKQEKRRVRKVVKSKKSGLPQIQEKDRTESPGHLPARVSREQDGEEIEVKTPLLPEATRQREAAEVSEEEGEIESKVEVEVETVEIKTVEDVDALSEREENEKKKEGAEKTAGERRERASSVSSLSSASITSVDKDNVRKELEAWRRQRNEKADVPSLSSSSSSSSSETKEHFDVQDMDEVIASLVKSTETEDSEDPKDISDLRHVANVEAVVAARNKIVASRCHSASAYERYLESYHARLVEWEKELQQSAEGMQTDRCSTPPPMSAQDNKFTLRHKQSAMMVTIKSNALILSNTRLPSVFRIEKGALLHAGTNRIVVPGFFQGRDPCLQVKSKAVDPCEWVYDPVTMHLKETRYSNTAVVMPYDQTCSDGVQLVLSETDEDGSALGMLLIERVDPEKGRTPTAVTAEDSVDARILLDTRKVETPPPTPNRSFSWAIPSEDSESFERHRMRLITEVKEKHIDYAEKERRIDTQGRRCKGCLSDLKKTYSALYFSWRYDTVHFCWYLGAYYCSGCHDNSFFMPIPARLIYQWDSKPKPVCSDAYNYLNSIWARPIVCISALNPLLFEKVTALKMIRAVRVQLNILYTIVQDCSLFADFVNSHPSFISNETLYYLEGSELFSAEDILRVTQTQPYLEYPTRLSPPLLTTLEGLRNKMITHVVNDCPDKCGTQAAKTCESCAEGGDGVLPIYEFETGKVQTCPKCSRVYHKACYQMQPCKYCF